MILVDRRRQALRRLEGIFRAAAETIAELAAAGDGGAADEWVDQAHSPLGRRRHRELAKAGTLPSAKDGRRILIRRSEIDRYLKRKMRAAVDARTTEEKEVARVVQMVTGATKRTG